MFSPAKSGKVKSFCSAAFAESACKVQRPGMPEFRATNISSASAPLTSPITNREGRMRSDCFTNSRRPISLVPSALAGLTCIATQSLCSMASSKVSSQEINRSCVSSSAKSAVIMVVLPAWVAPAIRMLCCAFIADSSFLRCAGFRVPSRSSSESVIRPERNLRIFIAQLSRVSSGITTCSLEPSGKFAST